MKKVILLNKKIGETPLQALERFRLRHKTYKEVKMTYAGRLDPMASGLLLVLAGEEIKNKEKYLGLDKEYEFEILFGFATDTHDILGKVISLKIVKQDLTTALQESLKHFTGKFVQKYPIYSSKAVKGKQLWEYARESVQVELPEREVFVKKLQFIKIKKVASKKLLYNIEKRIQKVMGDFRQKEILKTWQQNLKTKTTQHFYIASFKIKCSSGTYVRGIANDLGEKTGTPTLAYSIKRTKIGKWAKAE